MNITPETDERAHRNSDNAATATAPLPANETDARIEELDAASEAIEETVQRRLQQHSAQRLKHAEVQKRIQHQSFVGKQLIGGAGGLKVVPNRYRVERTSTNAYDAVEKIDDENADVG